MSELEEFELSDEERESLYEGLTGEPSPERYAEEVESAMEAAREWESWLEQSMRESEIYAGEMGGMSFPLTDIERFLGNIQGEFYYVNYYQHAPNPTTT